MAAGLAKAAFSTNSRFIEFALAPALCNTLFPVSNAFVVSGDVAIFLIEFVIESIKVTVFSLNFNRGLLTFDIADEEDTLFSSCVLFPFCVKEVGIIFLIEPSNEAIKESDLGLVVSELPSSAGVFCVNFSVALFITEPIPLAAF